MNEEKSKVEQLVEQVSKIVLKLMDYGSLDPNKTQAVLYRSLYVRSKSRTIVEVSIKWRPEKPKKPQLRVLK